MHWAGSPHGDLKNGSVTEQATAATGDAHGKFRCIPESARDRDLGATYRDLTGRPFIETSFERDLAVGRNRFFFCR